MTFEEMDIKIEAYLQKLKNESQKPVIDAWCVGFMVKLGIGSLFEKEIKYPKLEELLNSEEKKTEPMTPEAMEAHVVAFAKAFGAKEIIIDEG